MKKIAILVIVVLLPFITFAQTDNEITTLRIGPFKIYSKLSEVGKHTTQTFNLPSEQNDYKSLTLIKFNNEIIEVDIQNMYDSKTEKDIYQVYSIATQSPKFRTKAGIGIGSKREEVFKAFKNFNSFEAYPGWDDNGKRSKIESYFVVNDLDAGTQIIFKLKNNIVVKFTVTIREEGC
jgi:hypothetical protein